MITLILATLAASPTNLPAVLDAAQPGDTIQLAPGSYGRVEIKGRSWSPRIFINASGAKMTLSVSGSRGLYFRGGQFGPATGTGVLGYAAQVVKSRDVSFYRSGFVNSARGLVISQSQDVKAGWVRFTGMTVDGANIASSQRVQISDSVCEKFNTGEAHPDCIQMWSRSATGITADVKLLRNRSIGPGMQGFTAFNHVRDGVDDGGFDRVTIVGNYVEGSYPQGINLTDCRACVVTDNVTRTIPGSRWRVSINIVRSTGVFERNDVGPR